MLLLDINVWIAMAFDGHVHHPVARKWFDGLSDNDFCIFCRLTQQGFLRLASSPQIFGSNALTLVDAWQKYDAFLSDPRVSFMVEPVGIEQQWRDLTRTAIFSTKVWSDAWLAAFALAANLEVITFDKAFVQYAGLCYTTMS
jgi:toxin-antitoxin system PIN domain toxin